MKTTNAQFKRSIKIRNIIIGVLTFLICILALRQPKDLVNKPEELDKSESLINLCETNSDFEQIVQRYSYAIFECTIPNKNAEHAWGVFEEKIDIRSNFQEAEITNGFTMSFGHMINVYTELGTSRVVATCNTKKQAQRFAEILTILKGNGSQYGEVSDLKFQ